MKTIQYTLVLIVSLMLCTTVLPVFADHGTEIAATDLDFGTVCKDSVLTNVLYFENTTSSDVTISNVKFEADEPFTDSTELAPLADDSETSTSISEPVSYKYGIPCREETSLDAGDKCFVSIDFAPEHADSFKATLIIFDGRVNSDNSVAAWHLTGTGKDDCSSSTEDTPATTDATSASESATETETSTASSTDTASAEATVTDTATVAETATETATETEVSSDKKNPSKRLHSGTKVRTGTLTHTRTGTGMKRHK